MSIVIIEAIQQLLKEQKQHFGGKKKISPVDTKKILGMS